MGMNMMDMIMQAAGGQAPQQIGQQFGLNQQQSQSAISALLPAISTAMKQNTNCLLYTSPSPRDLSTSRMPSSA